MSIGLKVACALLVPVAALAFAATPEEPAMPARPSGPRARSRALPLLLATLLLLAGVGALVPTSVAAAPTSPPTAGLRVARIGRTYIRYEIGIFRNDENTASAEGHFIHVYVDRETQTVPTPLPPALRDAVQPLLAG